MVTLESVGFTEQIIFDIETVLPPINSFIVPGGSTLGAYLDVCRAISRRAERRIVLIFEKEACVVSQETVQFMNRLSSLLYALARFANYQQGYFERSPEYE